MAVEQKTHNYVRRVKPREADVIQLGRYEKFFIEIDSGDRVEGIKYAGNLPPPYVSIGWGCSREGCLWFVSESSANTPAAYRRFNDHDFHASNWGIVKRKGKGGKNHALPEPRCIRVWMKGR